MLRKTQTLKLNIKPQTLSVRGASPYVSQHIIAPCALYKFISVKHFGLVEK